MRAHEYAVVCHVAQERIERCTVTVLANRIDPDEHPIHAEQLLPHLVGVDCSLDVEADVAQRLRDIAEPRVLQLQRRAHARVAGKHHGHSESTRAHLMTLPRVERSRRAISEMMLAPGLVLTSLSTGNTCRGRRTRGTASPCCR